ncbi:glycosyltransferase family 2 protein [Gordonibacter massiliensis (ex Traore et al. 2017)]|uniref:glycosyltransferase family 2 protein n=1 Tax=Gordonibacter massiliensis (ex Traore et al. 2017) TaxID=1841863 RepID=UPI001C8B7EFA|nr:glycosyltransferase family 2 protein [Gordonibacter massiliensis (ex Traore et al. 2017)]MBX9033646.1 glycosyltransferase family 2 protein [Gordonibacter massiliensis (ex Traore et al. 2017)]
MKIEINEMFRGDGKAYVRLSVGELGKGNTLTAHGVSSQGFDFPIEIYEFFPDSNEVSRSYVVELPILTLDQIVIVVSEITSNGEELSSFEFPLSSSALKWKSRANYLANKEMCAKIKDYGRGGFYEKLTMNFWDCIADCESNILRGVLYEPYYEDSVVRLECMTTELKPIESNVVFLHNAKSGIATFDDVFMREIQFSLRLPKDERDLVFILRDEFHPSCDSFEAIEGWRFDSLLEATRNIMLDAANDPSYPEWFSNHKIDRAEYREQRKTSFSCQPRFSIIVPLYNTPLGFFEDMIASVRGQSYETWELILVNASLENKKLSDAVERAVSEDSRITNVTLPSNLGISENTNAGLRIASGDFVCFLDHDDVLEVDTLFEYARALNKHDDIDLIYCDEDKLLPGGEVGQPFFKPDFSPDLLRSLNYICHFLAIRKNVLEALEPNTSEFDGAQDYNMTLQATERARRIHHVPRVLYHWRINPGSTAENANNKAYAVNAGIKALENHLTRMGIRASVSEAKRPTTYRVEYEVPEDNPLVSIVIPNKDESDVLDTCLKSIIEKTTYDNYEIVLVENNSTDQKTFSYYARLGDRFGNKVRVEHWLEEFNFSKLMNFGASKARGDYLLLLNNDTEIITPNWLEILVGLCSREDVGAVGVRLFFMDETVQHAGICVDAPGVAGHIGRGLPRGNAGYFNLGDVTQNFSAVTAACMMTKRRVFDEVGGFDEELAVAFNDVDYCFKLREANYLIVYTPEVELFHYESLSRGLEDSPEKQMRFLKEVSRMRYRWSNYFVCGDPYLNKNLCQSGPGCLFYHL